MAIEAIPLQFPDTLEAGVYKDFGREIKGADVNNLSESEFSEIERLVYQHNLLLFRDCNLSPERQLALVKAFDPLSNNYGHGNKEVEKTRGSLLNSLIRGLPEYPQIQLIGNGVLKNHEGIPEITLKHSSHKSFHSSHLSVEDEERGITRFYRWHMDAALYDLPPPKVTALYGLRVPTGPKQICRYDDGSGDELQLSLCATAFVSGKVMFDLLPPDLKSLAVRTRVRYAPHPFVWMACAGARPTGLGLETNGKEVPYEELPEWEEAKVQTLPMVWKNPVSKELHLQVHPCAATELIVDPVPANLEENRNTSARYPCGVRINDLQEVRRLLEEIQRPAIAPKFVYPHEWHERDLILFHNRGVIHTATGTLKEDQVRVFHQCNLAPADFPTGPSAEDVAKWA